MLIEKTNLKDSLKGKTVLLTGGGGGIGFETARSLAWMGATVVIAEIDRERGKRAAETVNCELQTGRAVFYEADLSDESQIDGLYSFIIEKYGFLDVIFNNATITPIGRVDELPISDWDKSYAVNLKAPVLLARKFLPHMIQKNEGTIVFVPSSGAAPYMGAYETFKTAQVEVSNTLAVELENTNINVFSIGPGLVKTETAQTQIARIAGYMGISIEEFYEINKNHILDAESAGAGFAVSVALAKQYKGQEIGCIQALMDAGVYAREKEQSGSLQEQDKLLAGELISKICSVYQEQHTGWLKRSIFERQWVLRDLKKVMKLSAEQVKEKLESLQKQAGQGNYASAVQEKALFGALLEYYRHQLKLLQGYEKDPVKLEENTKIIQGWMDTLEKLLNILS